MVFVTERGVVYSRLYLPQILSRGSLCGQVSGLEILLCEDGDVELCARTSKFIRVFAFDPLTLTLSLSCILCRALIHIVISYLYAWLVCVCLTCA